MMIQAEKNKKIGVKNKKESRKRYCNRLFKLNSKRKGS